MWSRHDAQLMDMKINTYQNWSSMISRICPISCGKLVWALPGIDPKFPYSPGQSVFPFGKSSDKSSQHMGALFEVAILDWLVKPYTIYIDPLWQATC